MRLLYFHQYFGTPKGAGGTRSYEQARALIAAGHQVTMICGSDERSATGVSAPFVGGQRRGVVDGIDVLEFDLGYSNEDGLSKRAWKFLVYAWRSMGVAVSSECDLVFATSTPLTAALPGAAAKLLRGRPFVFEVRDLWPELPKAMGMKNPAALLAMTILERLGYGLADRVVALAPGIADGLVRTGFPRHLIVEAPNGCDVAMFDAATPVRPSELFPERIAADDFVAIFAGAHGRANGLDAVIAAAAVLKQRGVAGLKLLLIGRGSEKARLVAAAAAAAVDDIVVFQDSVPKTQIAGLIKGSDLGLQVLANVRAFYDGTSPNKFFDYLSAGRPVLINYPGWLGRLVAERSCGYVVPPDEPEAFADALIQAASDTELRAKGANARALAEERFLRDDLATKFRVTLEQVVGEHHARAALRAPLKRTLDVVGAALGLVLLSPVLVFVALLVRARLGGPVLFRQVRPGLGGRPFRMLKFRTMLDARTADGALLPDSERLTLLGRMLRATSLDELPELWNVLCGDMSLVGPRPLLMQYLPLYSAEQARRHEVRPGVTGWAQINGRNAISWDDKFRLDVWYVDHRSILLDLKVLALTVWKVLRRDGVSADQHATMPIFTGSGMVGTRGAGE